MDIKIAEEPIAAKPAQPLKSTWLSRFWNAFRISWDAGVAIAMVYVLYICTLLFLSLTSPIIQDYVLKDYVLKGGGVQYAFLYSILMILIILTTLYCLVEITKIFRIYFPQK
jgi:hypothetical protein